MWEVEFDVDVEHDGSSDDLKDFLLLAYGELRRDQSVFGQRIWAELEADRVTFKVVARDPDRSDATACATAAVRCALHAAGGSTPGWEHQSARLESALDRSRIASSPVTV